MSVKRSAAIWDHSLTEGHDRLVMLCLADHADDDGYAWPGDKRVAEKVRVHPDSITRIVKHLVAIGELYAVRGQGRGNKSRYLVLPGLSEEEIGRALAQRFELPPLEVSATLAEIREARKKGDATPPFSGKKKVAQRTTEKVTRTKKKGDARQKKGDAKSLKGDTVRENAPTDPLDPSTDLDPLRQPSNGDPSRARGGQQGFGELFDLTGNDPSRWFDRNTSPAGPQAHDAPPSPNPLPDDDTWALTVDAINSDLTARSGNPLTPQYSSALIALARGEGLTARELLHLWVRIRETAHNPPGWLVKVVIDRGQLRAPDERAPRRRTPANTPAYLADDEAALFEMWWLTELAPPPFADAVQRERYSAWLVAEKQESGNPDRPDYSPHALFRRELAQQRARDEAAWVQRPTPDA